MRVMIDSETLKALIDLAWETSKARKALFGDAGYVSESYPRRCNDVIYEADCIVTKEDKAA